MKRVIVRSFIIFVVLAVIGQIAGFLASRYFGHDADPEDDEFRIVNIWVVPCCAAFVKRCAPAT